MDREAWRAAIHGITKSRTSLSNWTELIAMLGTCKIELQYTGNLYTIFETFLLLLSHCLVQLFAIPWTKTHLTFIISWSLLKLMFIKSVLPSMISFSAALYSSCPQSFQASSSISFKNSNSDQCKDIEVNNRMGKTRDLFKKIRDSKGTFHAKVGTIKDRNCMNLTEAENTKKRWQEYTEL